MVAVEGVNGFDVGMINITGELVAQPKKNKIDEKTLRSRKYYAGQRKLIYFQNAESKAGRDRYHPQPGYRPPVETGNEKNAEVEIQADGRTATFLYSRRPVDFELIKVYAGESAR